MSQEHMLEDDATEKQEAKESRDFDRRYSSFKPGEANEVEKANQQNGDRYSGFKPGDGGNETDEEKLEGEVDLESKEGFASEKLLNKHFKDHGQEFDPPFKTREEYENAGKNFMHKDLPDGALEKTRHGGEHDGDRVRYDPNTEEFGVVRKDGVLRTYYIPDPAVHKQGTNLDYYNAQ